MQHPRIGHVHAKRPVTFREIRTFGKTRRTKDLYDCLLMAANECDAPRKLVIYRIAAYSTFANVGFEKCFMTALCGYCFVALRNDISPVGQKFSFPKFRPAEGVEMANLTTCKPSFEMRYVFPKAIVDGVPNPRHSGVASKVGIQYTDADVSLFFLADAFRFYQHYSAR